MKIEFSAVCFWRKWTLCGTVCFRQSSSSPRTWFSSIPSSVITDVEFHNEAGEFLKKFLHPIENLKYPEWTLKKKIAPCKDFWLRAVKFFPFSVFKGKVEILSLPGHPSCSTSLMRHLELRIWKHKVWWLLYTKRIDRRGG